MAITYQNLYPFCCDYLVKSRREYFEGKSTLLIQDHHPRSPAMTTNHGDFYPLGGKNGKENKKQEELMNST
jgi:hypothetical protein